MTIDKHELASALARLLRELPGHASWGTDLRLLQVSLAEYNEKNAELSAEEILKIAAEGTGYENLDSVEEEDQPEELLLLKLILEAYSCLGPEPSPKMSKPGSEYISNSDEITQYHVIRAALVRCSAYVNKKMP